MTWLMDNQAVAVNMDSASKMRSRYRDNVLGQYWTVEVTSATNTLHDFDQFETEQDARDWIDAFISS